MAHYVVTVTVEIDVPEGFNNDEDIEYFLTNRLDQAIDIAYEIDDYQERK